MNTMDIMQAPLLSSHLVGPRRPAPPSAPQLRPLVPASIVAASMPPCQSWGSHGASHGLVQREAFGLTVTINAGRPGNRVVIDVAMDADTALELAVRLVAQADAWRRENGQGGIA